MKKLVLLLALIGVFAYANNDKTPSKIRTVTLYLSGAQITRSATVDLNSGTTEIVLDKLSPYIQESSIQVSGLNGVSILSINYGVNYLSKHDFSEEIKTIKDQIEALKDKIQLEENIISGYMEELQLIKSNRNLGNEKDVVSLDKLKSFSDYYRKQLTHINNEIFASQKHQNDYKDQIGDLTKQLSEFNINEKIQSGEITIKLNTNLSSKLNLEIKYNVTNAGWFPVYDLNAKKINEPLSLSYKAHVYQNTGVEWNDVKLVLSTSDPNINNHKPEVLPKYLNFTSRYNSQNRQEATKRYDYIYNPTVKTVSGTILDESGSPLPGVNITVKGTPHGTQTDFDGNYSLEVSGGKELVFSYLGYNTETIPINSSVMNLKMDENLVSLEEVVVTGYGIANKSETIDSMLQGSASGVHVSGANGKPGSAMYTKVRGVGSISQGKNPLYIIDGEVVRDMNLISPDDIATMEVLKDADATSLYGSRASNGVVVITTKNTTSTGAVIEEGITNLRFEIKDPYTIKTEEDVTVIEIETYEVPADYVYFAAPVLNENVFLTAKVTHWEQYNLLPGEANVYFEGSYSGKTMLNPYATKDTLTVSLGVDPNVVVKRNELKDFKSKQFIGGNRILDKGYEIEIRNNKKTNINIVLVDRIPVSQNKEIKVEDVETGNSEYDTEKGLLTWKLNLSPSESQKRKFSYQLRFPKYKSISL